MDEQFIKQLEKSQIKTCKNGKTRSEIGKSSKRKGKSGERKIADLLTKISEVPFIRIPNSGAQLGKANRHRIEQYFENHVEAMLGDIFPPRGLKYRFIIESKNYKSFPWKKIENGECPAKLEGWVGEINYDTETYLMCQYSRDPIPFLGFNITGENGRGEGLYICYNEKYYIDKKILTKPLYKVNISINEFMKNKGFDDNWIVENLEEFIIRNKDILFQGDF